MPLRDMIDREITCMRDAASPFMMRFYGEFDEGGESFMLLECLGGGSLEDLSPTQVTKVASIGVCDEKLWSFLRQGF